MATRKNGGSFKEEVRQEYIRQMLGKFLQHRFDDVFMGDIGDFRYDVSADYDHASRSYRVTVRSGRGLMMGLMVAEERMFEVRNNDDWMQYQLERMEPLMDTLVFLEWFISLLTDEDDRRVFQQHLAPLIKSVTFRPPPRHAQGIRHMARNDIDPHKIGYDWLAIVNFANGAQRREQICNIHKEIDTWFSMLLMAADNRKLTMSAAM